MKFSEYPFFGPKFMLALLQHQRDENTEKHGQRNHRREIGTKKRTIVLQVCFKIRSVNKYF